jgi:phthalate 4,5-dioxygenase
MTPATNELLTRVGPGTPMGSLMRCYWLPALLSSELPDPDGPPIRVRLLGEDLVAFRVSSGEIGLLEQHCPHRRASLFFGRNEEGGLRCAYHGLKFGIAGECLELPTEPDNERLRRSVRARAYPCVERNGIVWTFMGRAESPRAGDLYAALPPLPEIEWNLAPANHSVLWRSLRTCNWLQCLEGDVDQFHQSFLHTRLDDAEDDQQYVTVPGKRTPARTGTAALRILRRVKTPIIHSVETNYGLMYASERKSDDAHRYYRVRHFLFPFFTLVGGDLAAPEFVYNCKAWVPMDDTHTLVLESQFRPDRAWRAEEAGALMEIRNPAGFLPPTSEPGGAWRPQANSQNDYLRDLEQQRTTLYCGILSNPVQDAAIQESMGPIVDRTRERLTKADVNIVYLRRQLARAAEDLRDHGTPPPGSHDASAYRCRPLAITLPEDADWIAETELHRHPVSSRE